MIVECIALGLVAGVFAGAMTVAIVYLIRRQLSYKAPKLPKSEFTALSGVVVFVGGIAWSRPLLITVLRSVVQSELLLRRVSAAIGDQRAKYF